MMEAWPFKVNYPEQGISFSGALHHWVHKSVSGIGKNKDIPAPIAFGDFGGGRAAGALYGEEGAVQNSAPCSAD
jgi:hypothetical protein